MMAVEVTPTSNDVQLAAPHALFADPYAYGAGITIANYDVAKDQRFVMVKDDPRAVRLRVIVNWHAEGTTPRTR